MSSESDRERPEARAFRELDLLVRRLGDELAVFRRRALQAEARVKELEAALPVGGTRNADLVRENDELKARIEAASARTRHLLERMRFARQQQGKGTAR